MNFTINLQRSVEVNAWRFQGEVGLLEPQPWLVAVARMAAERQSKISTHDVGRHLLGGRLPIARGLIQRCISLGLLTEDGEVGELVYQLTQFGRRAAERGEVFVPHPGTWTLWLTEDEMFDDKFLLLEPWREPSALDEGGRNRHIGRARSFETTPQWLRALEGRELKLPMGEYREVRIMKILDQAENAGDGLLRVEAHITSNAAGTHQRLIGTLDQPPRKGKASEPKLIEGSARRIAIGFEECWQSLLESEGMTDAWDADSGALRVSFPANENERRTRSGERRFNNPCIPNLGVFDATLVRGIPLCAATTGDAQKWAVWLLQNKITSYATGKQFQEWASEAGEPFLKWKPPLPTRQELATSVVRHKYCNL